MTGLQPSAMSFISVSEMAELCQISRSRFYDLMHAGIFPKPVQHPSSKRPMFNLEMQKQCQEIRQTGIDANGQPVLFNRKPKNSGQPRPQRKPEPEKKPVPTELLEALEELGLKTTGQAVTEALAHLFPTGHAGHEHGDVVRKVFLHLQGRKKADTPSKGIN
jgi:hypothetical protein